MLITIISALLARDRFHRVAKGEFESMGLEMMVLQQAQSDASTRTQCLRENLDALPAFVRHECHQHSTVIANQLLFSLITG